MIPRPGNLSGLFLLLKDVIFNCLISDALVGARP